jgi:hypothetical protein
VYGVVSGGKLFADSGGADGVAWVAGDPGVWHAAAAVAIPRMATAVNVALPGRAQGGRSVGPERGGVKMADSLVVS